MKKTIGSAIFIFFCVSVAYAENFSASSVPFRSVDYLGGSKTLIHFKGIIINENFWDLSVPIEAVEIMLERSTETYTTLNLLNAGKDPMSFDWLKAEKVTVVVRSESDLLSWKKFLAEIKRKQEETRKKLREPTRVLPPNL